jgi:hypothetical protein
VNCQSHSHHQAVPRLAVLIPSEGSDLRGLVEHQMLAGGSDGICLLLKRNALALVNMCIECS